MKTYNLKKGFTLIELLIVIAIIGILSSVVLASVTIAKAKARDAKKQAAINSIKTGLTQFHFDNERMPKNYNCGGTYCSSGTGTVLAVEDMNNPDNPQTESGKAFKASMDELVAAGYLSQVPKSPGGAPYKYFDYGPMPGAIIATTLEAGPSIQYPAGNNCRPFSAQGEVEENSPRIAAAFGIQTAKAQFSQVTPICKYWTVENGQAIERTCPSGQSNFCSTNASSKDYCVCNAY